MYYTGSNAFASLRNGLVGAWCPSLANGGSGNLLPDQSGRANHGTLTNMSAGAWVSGQYGKALDFDGVNDFINVPDSPSLNFGISDFTATGWFYARNVSTFESTFFAENNPGAGNPQWWFRQENTSGAVRFLTASTIGETSTQSANGILTSDTWTHFVCRRKDQQLAIYKNGDLISSTTGTIRDVSSSQPFVIGLVAAGYLQGQADDIRLYSRALTEPEIKLLASKRGIGLQPSPTRFIARQKQTGLRRRILTGQT